MGEASREGVLRVAPCCRSTLTQAALPRLQELNRGVAPSVDTASTCEGGTPDQLGQDRAGRGATSDRAFRNTPNYVF